MYARLNLLSLTSVNVAPPVALKLGSTVGGRPTSGHYLFAGALIPGLLLVFLYVVYLLVVAFFQPDAMPAHHRD